MVDGPEERRVLLRLVSQGAEATEELGLRLGRLLEAGDVVGLDGELGAGKTCLARGIARGLGVTETVSSPSFTLLHEHLGRVPVRHYDAWMREREGAFLEESGWDGLGGGGVAIVEWAASVAAYLPSPRLEVRLTIRSPSQRGLELALVPGPATPRSKGRPEAESGPRLARAVAGLSLPEGITVDPAAEDGGAAPPRP